MATDPYSILEVPKTATEAEIKKAYKRLARKFHPDLNKAKAAEDKFKQVTSAFEILGNPEKRKMYDEFGEDAVRFGFDPEKARQYRAWGAQAGPASQGRARSSGTEDVFGGFGGLGDLFGDFLGGGRGQPTRPQAGADAAAEITIDLVDALRGSEIELTASLPKACAACQGTGRAAQSRQSPCRQCGGTGRLAIGGGRLRTTCPACGGSGQAQQQSCDACGGRGATYQHTRLKVRIPAGIADGGKIRLGGKGEPGFRGGPPGDLIIEVHVRPHAALRREGSDLHLTVPITVPEAVLGATIEVPTLEGSVRLKVPAGAQTGQPLRLRGKGAPDPAGGARGDLYVELSVRSPDRIDESTREAARKLESGYAGDVRAELKL
jgi:molecular chaperone DnaJ